MNEHYRTCQFCNYDQHQCPGCGTPTGHLKDNVQEICEQCRAEIEAGER